MKSQRILHLKSLRAKILVFAVLPIFLLQLILIVFIGFKIFEAERDATLKRLDVEVKMAADSINAANREATIVPEIMARAQEAGLFGKRHESSLFAKRILEEHPAFTGAYVGYETNADGQDAQFKTPGSDPTIATAQDSTGRYLPYWFRNLTNDASVMLEPLKDMETSFYYRGLKNRVEGVSETQGVELEGGVSRYYDPANSPNQHLYMVTEPYNYLGKFMVEQTFPIIRNGRFAGICGVDRALRDMEELVGSLKPFPSAEFLLVSRRGRIISSTLDKSLRARKIEDTPYAELLRSFYLKPPALPVVLVDPVDKKEHVFHAVRIPVGQWTLVSRIDKTELTRPAIDALFWPVGAALAGVVVVVFVLTSLAGVVSRRVGYASGIAEKVAEGDLTCQVVATGNDETGNLLKALNGMIKSLNSLVGKVRLSSIQLVSTATQISASSKSQKSAVHDLGASTHQMAAAVNEISATSRELSDTMTKVAVTVSDASRLANLGRQSLGGLGETMRSLEDATRSISGKLNAMSERARNITSVVTTITKVADQTNLLSLNAAIEAEKAGEYGLGFSVVAREIRRLADQTAVGTLDIGRIVGELQNAVSAGVMEMEKFSDEVNRGVRDASGIGNQLGEIISAIEKVTPQFQSITEGMQAQSTGAGQISEAMVQFKESVHTTGAAIGEFEKATTNLYESVKDLREEISRFKVE